MRRVLNVALAGALLLHVPVWTQQPSSPQTSFGVGTTAVMVDVVVRDKQGRPVTDLKASDFELLEDKVPQEIGAVTLVTPGTLASSGTPSTAVAPGGTPAARGTTVEAPTFVALVFERLTPEARALAHKGAMAYLETARPDDFAGVFAIDQALHTVQTYTTDRGALRKAIDDVSSRAGASFSRGNDRVRSSARGDSSPSTPVTASAESPGPSDPKATATDLTPLPAAGQGQPASPGRFSEILLRRMEQRMERSYESLMRDQQGLTTINALMALIDSLGVLPGRKTAVFFAEGLAIPANVQARFDSVVAAANRANVSIYSVDAAGLRVHSDQREAAQNINRLGANTLDRDPENPGGKMTESLEFNEDVLRQDPNASLGMLADRTGGFLINNTNDLEQGFRTIDADRRFHYLLTYVPKNSDFKGEYRTISVRVPGRDVHVRARNGYLAVRSASAIPLLAYEAPAMAALDRTPLPKELPVRAGAFPMPDPQGNGRLALLVAADTTTLTFKPDGQNKAWQTDFTVLARIKDASGEVVRKASQPYRLSGPMGELESARRGDVLFYRQPDLPPGTYTLEAVVHDALGGKAGAASAPLVVPAPRPGAPVVSSLIIVRRTEKVPAGERATDNPLFVGDLLLYPNLGEPLRKSVEKTVSFFLRVNPAAGGAAPTATLELLSGKQVIGQVPMELAKPNAAGVIEQSSQLPLGNFPAGTYGLRITISQGTEKVVREAGFTVVE